MSRLVFDWRNKIIQHQKKWLRKGKKVLLSIKRFVVDKKHTQKVVNNASFKGSLKKNTEYRNKK